jgi:hypothetical protein
MLIIAATLIATLYSLFHFLPVFLPCLCLQFFESFQVSAFSLHSRLIQVFQCGLTRPLTGLIVHRIACGALIRFPAITLILFVFLHVL